MNIMYRRFWGPGYKYNFLKVDELDHIYHVAFLHHEDVGFRPYNFEQLAEYAKKYK